MSITRSIAAAAAMVALFAVPSAAIAVGPPTNPGGGHKPAGTPTPPASPSTDQRTQASNPGAAHNPATRADTPGPDAPASAKAKAYGRLCRTESKKHVAGEKGTPFSRCVTAMAKAASGEATSARTACAGMSRKHTAGERGTPFSRCVVAAGHIVDESDPAGA